MDEGIWTRDEGSFVVLTNERFVNFCIKSQRYHCTIVPLYHFFKNKIISYYNNVRASMYIIMCYIPKWTKCYFGTMVQWYFLVFLCISKLNRLFASDI